MFKFFMVRKEDCHIHSRYWSEESMQDAFLNLGDLGNPDVYVHVKSPIDLALAKAQRDANGNIEIVVDVEKSWNVFRKNRNKVLSATDWTQCSDCTLSQEEKDEYTAYRQLLRDLPSTVEDPNSVTWPEAPTSFKDNEVLDYYDEDKILRRLEGPPNEDWTKYYARFPNKNIPKY